LLWRFVRCGKLLVKRLRPISCRFAVLLVSKRWRAFCDITRIDKPRRLGFPIISIPAKPLVQAKLKCGGFFNARTGFIELFLALIQILKGLTSAEILGGKTVIQAKRCTNTVGVAAVRELYGTVLNEGAMKGIIVTTADYGPDAYEFAADKPLVLLNGGNLLSLLGKHGHMAKIDLMEAKRLLGEQSGNGAKVFK